MGILLKDNKVLYASENIGKINIDVDPTQPQSVNITGAATLAAIANSTVQLAATVLPQTAIDKSVSWSSSNPSIATVSSTGLVTRTAPLTNDDGQPLSVTITARTVNGVTGSIVLQAAMLQLPAGAFAVFDGIVGARNAIAGQWQDMSGNDNHMTIGYGTADQIWGQDCFLCPSSHAHWGKIANSSFDISSDYTLSYLIAYDESASQFDASQGGENNLDCLACLNYGQVPRQQIGIGARNGDYDKKMFSAIKPDSSTGYETLYTSQAAASLSGLKLITFVKAGANISVYLDGALLGTVAHTAIMAAVPAPPLAFFSTAGDYTSIYNNTGYRFNFFGSVYGVAVYNRALTATEVAAVKAYYTERYSNYYTGSNES